MSARDQAAGWLLLFSAPGAGKNHRKGRTLELFAFNFDATAVVPDDLVADTQTQSLPLPGCLC